MEESSSQSVSDKFEEANVLCPVCFESLLEAERLALPGTCVHVFCLDCITAWSSYSNSCPIDRLQFDQIVVKEYIDGPVLETICIKNEKSNEPVDDGIIELSNCEICNLSHNEETLLLCDGCDRAYHCACLDPPLLEVPVDDWFCQACNVNQINQNTSTSRRQSTRSVARTRFAERVRAEVQIARELASDWLEETPRSSRRKRRSLLMNASPAASFRSEEAGAVAIRRRLVRRLGLVKSRDCPGLSQYGIKSESKGTKSAQTVQLNICGSVRDCTPVDQETSFSRTFKEISKVNQMANPNLLSSILQSQEVLMLPDHRVHISTSGSIKSINDETDTSFDINKAVLGSPSKARATKSDVLAKGNAGKIVENVECEPVLESFMTESPENNGVPNPPSAETELPNQMEKTLQTTGDVTMEETTERIPSNEPVPVAPQNDDRDSSQAEDSFHGLNISPFKIMRKLSNSESLSQEKHETVKNLHENCLLNDNYNPDQCNLSDQLPLETGKALGSETQSEGVSIPGVKENPTLKGAEFDFIASSDSFENSSSQLNVGDKYETSLNEAQNEPSKIYQHTTPEIGGIQFQLKKKDYEIPKKSHNPCKNDDTNNKITISDITKEPSAEELEKFGLPPQFNNYLNERSENSSGSEKEGYTRRNFNDFSSSRGGDRNWQGSRGGYQSPRGRWGPMIDDDSGRVNRNFFDRGRGSGFRPENRDGDHFANQRSRFDSQSSTNRPSKWEPIGEKREIQPPPFEPKKEDVVNSEQPLANHNALAAVENSEQTKAGNGLIEKVPCDTQEANSPSRKRGHSENRSETNNPETSEQPTSRNRSRSKSSDSRKRRRERSSSRRKNHDSDRDSRRSRERHNKDYSRNRDSDDYRTSRHRRSRSRSRRRNESDRYGRSDYRRHHSRGQDDDYRHKRSSYRDEHGSRRYSRHDEDRERRRHDDEFDKRSKEETDPKAIERESESANPEVDFPEPEKVNEHSKVGEQEQQCTPTKDEPNFEFSTGGFKEISKPEADAVDQMLNEAADFGANVPFVRFPLGYDGGRPHFRGDFSPRNRFPRNPRPPAFQHRMHAPPMMNPALNAMVNQPRMSAQQQQPQQPPQQQFAQMVSPNPQQRFGPPANFQRSPSSTPTFANPAFPGAPGVSAGVPPQNFLGGRIPFPFNAQQMRGQQPFPPNFLRQFAANMGNPNTNAEALLQGNDLRHVMNPSNLNAVGFPPVMGQDGATNPQANMTAALLNQIESNKLLQSISTNPASVFGTASPQQQQLQEAANLLKDIKTPPTAVSVGSSGKTAAAATAAVSPISLANIQSNMPMINNILESQLFQHQPPTKMDPSNPLSIFQQHDNKQQPSFIPETLFTQNSSPQSVEMEDTTAVNESLPPAGSPSNSIEKPQLGDNSAEEPPFLKSLATSDEKLGSQVIPFMENKIDEPLEKGISIVKEMLEKKNSGSGDYADDNSGSDHHSDIESSANEMQLKKKLVDRSEMQTKVAELVKGILMPHFKKRSITKDEYKDIMRKSVNKVVKRGSPDIKEEKITKLVNAYVDHYRARRTKPSKDDDNNLFWWKRLSLDGRRKTFFEKVQILWKMQAWTSELVFVRKGRMAMLDKNIRS